MSISSLSLTNASRASILRLQTQLRDAATEQNTGRHADVGRTLGQLTGTAVTYRAQESTIERMLESNKLVASRLELTDDAMEAVHKSATDLTSGLITGAATSAGTTTLVNNARSNLQQFVGALNLNVGGQYYMAGTMSDVQPVNDGSAAVQAKFQAFLTATGPGVTAATVDPDKLAAYFSDAGWSDESTSPATVYRFDDLFDVPTADSGKTDEWKLNWSNTTGDTSQTRISKTETINTSVSANEAAFRKIASAYTMVASLGLESMGDKARALVATEANKRLKAGMDGVVNLRSDIGMRLNRVEAADTGLTRQQDLVKAAYERLEGVDTTEAILRVNDLKTQLDAAYAVTGKLQSLSILNYL